MVKIRLRRVGAKKQPSYRVVVADSRAPRDGMFIESIGFYNPRTEPPTVRMEEARAIYWLQCGAQPTRAVERLLENLGILKKWARVKAGEDLEEVLAEEVAAEEVAAEEAAPEIEAPPEELEVEGLGLPTRVVNLLVQAGITGVEELQERLEEGELAAIPGLGPKSLEEIKEALTQRGRENR